MFYIGIYIHATCIAFFLQNSLRLRNTLVDIEDDNDFKRRLVLVHRLKRQCFLLQKSTNASAVLVGMEELVKIVVTLRTVTLVHVPLVTRDRSARQVRP